MGKPLVTAYQKLQAVISLLLILIVTIQYLIVCSMLWKRALIRRKMIERKCGNSETDFSLNASNEKQCRRFVVHEPANVVVRLQIPVIIRTVKYEANA